MRRVGWAPGGRQHLKEHLAAVNDDLSDGARLIDVCLKLLEDPQALYRRCDDEQRRLLNQAIFRGIYIDEEKITDYDLQEPFAHLHNLQKTREVVQADKPDPGTSSAVAQARNASRAAPDSGGGPAGASYLQVILGSNHLGPVF